jgi:AcrR family transcriptional regulator
VLRSSPRKEPRKERSRSLVDAIVEGAARLLDRERVANPLSAQSAKDKSGLTTNRVAEVAGVSIGSLYQYFPGKEAIVAALVRARLRATYDDLLDVLESNADAPLETAVAHLVDRGLALKESYAATDAGMIREALRNGLAEAAFAVDDEYVERFAAVLAKRRDQLRPDLPPDVAAYVLFQAVRWVVIVASVQRPELVREPAFRKELETLVVAYLRTAS